MTDYRYPSETPIFYLTLLLVLVALVLTAIPTFCLTPLLALGFIAISYFMSKSHHRQLLHSAYLITPQNAPQVYAQAQSCVNRLRPGPVEFYIVPERVLNAYTFGLSQPNVVVLYSPMLEVMDADELRFVIGHELGHVALKHTWLNTLLGGMGGVPVSFAAAVVLTLLFRWWNRACEYSADRAGLLACGNLTKSISALAQLAVGDINTQAELARALRLIEQEESSAAGEVTELLSSHPLILKRINELRKWAASDDFRRLAGRSI